MLYFNVENVRKEILGRAAAGSAIRIIVLDLSSSPGIDLAGVRMLGQLHKELQTEGNSQIARQGFPHGGVRQVFRRRFFFIGSFRRIGRATSQFAALAKLPSIGRSFGLDEEH
jgi:hypothetical protein